MNPIIRDTYVRYEQAEKIEQLSYDIIYLTDGCERLTTWINDIDPLGLLCDLTSIEWLPQLERVLQSGQVLLKHVGDSAANGITAWANPVNIANQRHQWHWDDDSHIQTESENYGLTLRGALLTVITEIKKLEWKIKDIAHRYVEVKNESYLRFSGHELLQLEMAKPSYISVYRYLRRIERVFCGLFENDLEWNSRFPITAANSKTGEEMVLDVSFKTTRKQLYEQCKARLNLEDAENLVARGPFKPLEEVEGQL